MTGVLGAGDNGEGIGGVAFRLKREDSGELSLKWNAETKRVHRYHLACNRIETTGDHEYRHTVWYI
jgi:hypothetical protein